MTLSVYSQSIDLINPVEEIGIKNWNIVNDNVMGGISNSDLYITKENNLMFYGNVSLKNNGGFASSRLRFNKGKLKDVKAFQLRVKGDGKIYKFRLRENYRSSNYSINFKTTTRKNYLSFTENKSKAIFDVIKQYIFNNLENLYESGLDLKFKKAFRKVFFN